ncbi:5'-adenylylsulfate reductase-like 5 [Carex littledalei]|uniref:5'-adenylylsulfate reductase-like 5 n=1 Tax=Carex littledalei TaxID=544730 RepID=A0A833VPC7_9POAL|nr:5'-adenylylsulfate reductase-like 5 [Carex littledalei]
MAWLRCLLALLFCISAFSVVESLPRLLLSAPSWLDGKSLDKLVAGLLRANKRGSYYAVLFFAKWCPFSRNFRPMFDALSYMFPQVTHLALEESAATRSLYSRYGIRSVPSVLLISGTSTVRFTDTKDISSLVAFYRENTDFEPVANLDVQPSDITFTSIWLQDIPLMEKVVADPYLALSVLFVLLRVALWILPLVGPHLRAFWVVYAQGLKQKVVGGMNHILERAAHVLDVKRLCNKLKHFNKKRNLRRGAKSARVWASSLASVSLGECSTSSRHAT